MISICIFALIKHIRLNIMGYAKEQDANNHSDGRTNNGGYRPGAGRKAGSGIASINKIIRFPLDLMKEATEAGVKKGQFTRMLIEGFRYELKKFIKSKTKNAESKN